MKEGWKQLGSIADIYNGDSINAEYKKTHFVGLEEGYPFIATKDVSPEGAVDYNNGVKIPADAGLKVAPSDSVFVCAEGGSAGKKIAYIEQEVCFGNKLFCIATKDKTKYSSKYIYYFCRSEKFRNQFFGELTGLIGGVSSKKFKGIECSFPHLSEQERIVSYLDAQFAKINALKTNTDKQLKEAQKLFQSALKEYLTPKEGWIKGCLGDFLNFRRGYDLTHAEMKEGDVPVAGSSGIIGYHNEATNISPCITVGRSGSVGKLNIYDKCWAHNTTLFVDDFKGNDPYFLAYLIQSLGVGSYSGGSAVPSLNRNYIHPIPTAVPFSKKEQRDIVVILDTLSEKVALLQKNYDQTITLCNDLKQSLLKSIFE